MNAREGERNLRGRRGAATLPRTRMKTPEWDLEALRARVLRPARKDYARIHADVKDRLEKLLLTHLIRRAGP